MTIGTYLRMRREAMNLTLKDIAEAVGVSEAAVSKWETGSIKNIRRDRIAILSKMLDISPLTIVFSEGDEIYIPKPKSAEDIIGSEDAERSELLQAISALPTDKLRLIVQLFK